MKMKLFFLEEGTKTTIIFRHFKSGLRTSNYRKMLASSAILLTKNKFQVFANFTKIVDVIVKKEMLSKLKISNPKDKLFVVDFKIEDFDETKSGEISIKMKIDKVVELLDKIEALTKNFNTSF